MQGWSPDLIDAATRLAALEKAFDYRGDITLTLADGQSVTGYIFDRKTGQTPELSCVRLMGSEHDHYISVPYDQIQSVTFSGKDAAHGKTWENWIKRYIESKKAGVDASIEADTLKD